MTNGVIVDEVCFDVTIPHDGFFFEDVPPVRAEVHGFRYLPAAAPGCRDSVLVLLHGVSQGAYAWDLPTNSHRYSVARPLAAAGYPVVAIDRLGYGASTHPPGGTLTIDRQADVTRQIVEALRTGSYRAAASPAYDHVGIVGHSIGTEIAELCVGQSGGVDVLVATGYTHTTSIQLALIIVPEVFRAFRMHYFYFGDTPPNRAALFYHPGSAVPAVVAAETASANLTPSGEVTSVVNRPSALVMRAITIPVLLVLAENDRLFPASQGAFEATLFGTANPPPIVTVPNAGHLLFLHPEGPNTVSQIIDWLRRHPTEIPACPLP
ncbi:MAG: alpha/beta hydrolase [Actinomycetota bacterium]|nr:alpha/beta hydrolase [Actinomycetota bacterium]